MKKDRKAILEATAAHQPDVNAVLNDIEFFPLCAKHGKPRDCFCKQDDTAICSSCSHVGEAHAKHDVIAPETRAKEVQGLLGKDIEALDSMVTHCDGIMATGTQLKEEVIGNAEDVKERVSEMAEVLVNFIMDFKDEVIEGVNVQRASEVAALELNLGMVKEHGAQGKAMSAHVGELKDRAVPVLVTTGLDAHNKARALLDVEVKMRQVFGLSVKDNEAPLDELRALLSQFIVVKTGRYTCLTEVSFTL